jgi:hypothetical protein
LFCLRRFSSLPALVGSAAGAAAFRLPPLPLPAGCRWIAGGALTDFLRLRLLRACPVL